MQGEDRASEDTLSGGPTRLYSRLTFLLKSTSMYYRLGILWGLVTILAGPAAWGADGRGRTVTLFFTGMVQGAFEPCGCKAGPTGGLARRAGYIGEYRGKHPDAVILSVDAGNYLLPPGPDAPAVNELMMESLRDLPLRVLNLAPEDLFYWKDLQRIQGPTEIISSNLFPQSPSIPAPKKYAVVEVSLGERLVKIGFLGLSDPAKVKPNSHFAGRDPGLAVAELKGELLRQADFLVILADLPLETARELARQFPEIYALILAEKRFVLHPPEQVNNAVLVTAVERGRYLGQLELQFDSQGSLTGFRPEWIELKEGLPEDPAFLRRQAQIR